MAKFKCSKQDKIICGVCGGLGNTFGLNAWVFRILFLLFGICLLGIVVYFLLAYLSE